MVSLCRSLLSLAKSKTKQITESIHHQQLLIIAHEQKLKKEIRILQQRINNAYKNETQTLNKFVETTLDEFIEIEEQKIELSYRPTNVELDKKSIYNLTNLSIPMDVQLAVSFGPKFCFDDDNNLLSMATFITDTTFQFENSCAAETHMQCYKIISAELTKISNREMLTADTWLEFLKYRVRKFINQHPDVLITRSDKGKHTIFIFKNDYISKMLNLITANNDYIEIPSIDIEALQNKNNKFIDQLVAGGTISETSSKQYKDFCCNPARMYGLIKVHKNDKPARPITSACDSPGFKLASFFSQLLSNLYNEQGLHLRNSNDIIEKLYSTTIEDDEMLASFDVVSMFTNITIDLMLSIIQQRSDTLRDQYHLDFETFREIMNFLLKECAVFEWNECFFRQNDTLAMGSPLSPILAKILMSEIMNKIITDAIHPKLVSLYVDDSLWILKRNILSDVHGALNNFHPRIQFTYETENDGRINFLDITIQREEEEKSLITNWYKKPFASSRLLNFYSRHEPNCILQTAIAFIKTILKLSSPCFFQQNKLTILETLRANCFPETVISHLIQKYYTLMTIAAPTIKYPGEYIPIPFKGKLTHRIKKRLSTFLTVGRAVGVPVRSGSRNFSYLKDPIEPRNKTNIIVILTCFCSQKMIVRKTAYLKRAGDILDLLTHNYHVSKKGKCAGPIHRFGKWQYLQIKNYSKMTRMFESLTYAFRIRLIDTKIHPPTYHFASHLNTQFVDIQQSLVNMRPLILKNKNNK